MRTFVYEPKVDANAYPKKYPGIVLYSAIFQNAPVIQRMARRIAGHGG